MTQISCCLVADLPLWKMEFVSWDDDIPNIWENEKMFQTTKPACIVAYLKISLEHYSIAFPATV